MQSLLEMPSEWLHSVFKNDFILKLNHLFLTSSKWLAQRHSFWNSQLNYKLSSAIDYKNPDRIYYDLTKLENYLFLSNLLQGFPGTIRYRVMKSMRVHLKESKCSFEEILDSVLDQDVCEYISSLTKCVNASDDVINLAKSYPHYKEQIRAQYGDCNQRCLFNKSLYNVLKGLLFVDFYVKPEHLAFSRFGKENKNQVIDLVLQRKFEPNMKVNIHGWSLFFDNMASHFEENCFSYDVQLSDEQFKLELEKTFDQIILQEEIIKAMIQINCTNLFELIITNKPYLLKLPFWINQSLLHLTIKNNQIDIVRLLIAQNFDINQGQGFAVDFNHPTNFIADFMGPTPLHFAIERLTNKKQSVENTAKLVQIITLLLQSNADLNKKAYCIIDDEDSYDFEDDYDSRASLMTIKERCEYLLNHYAKPLASSWNEDMTAEQNEVSHTAIQPVISLLNQIIEKECTASYPEPLPPALFDPAYIDFCSLVEEYELYMEEKSSQPSRF